MDAVLQAALEAQLLAMGDDELVLGHRDSEWCGHAPIVEEDIAFANIALDEIGHAQQWYTLLADLRGEDPDTYPDVLVYWRDWRDFRCAQIAALPKGDWAFSMLRQYLFDAVESARLDLFTQSAFEPLAQTAAKIRKEEIYHLRHTKAWVARLGLGTEESHARMQAGLDTLWPYTAQLFTPLADERILVEAGYIAGVEKIRAAWEGLVIKTLTECGLVLPSGELLQLSREAPGSHLQVLVTEMQSVARLDPEASW